MTLKTYAKMLNLTHGKTNEKCNYTEMSCFTQDTGKDPKT